MGKGVLFVMTRSEKVPQTECDLVMKGGITSGVVYPQAVLQLKERYRFRSIGGGSVGAVAAALTAAAEMGRDSGGFDKLKREQEELQKPGFLLDVFRAPDSTRPLLDTLLDLAAAVGGASRAGKSATIAVLRNLWLVLLRNCPRSFFDGVLIGVALGVALFFVAAAGLDSSLSGANLYVPMLTFGLLFGVLFGPLWAAGGLVRIVLKRLPGENFYGLCVGSGEPGSDERPLLTDWLSRVLDDLADIGNQGPLTFGHLRNKMNDAKPDEPGIILKMLTTNLNHGEPYVFPREANTFLFKRVEMDRFFPGFIVDYMVRRGARTGVESPDGYHFLPPGDDLPVIVPVRMGLSFPILLSAVPLYTVKESSWDERRRNPRPRLLESDLQRNLFSDGGICSNFPIHFFDSWLPGRPTFGINLTSAHEAVEIAEHSEEISFSASDIDARTPSAELVTRTERTDPTEPWLPKPDDPDSREWAKFESIAGFFMAILRSAMNYRDNMQSRLPSYQERIVQVPLQKGEGGLYLSMDSETIGRLADRGRWAGVKLLESFDPAREDNGFEHHQWVRLRVLLNQLETQLEGMDEVLRAVTVGDLVGKQFEKRYPYYLEHRHTEAGELLHKLGQLVEYLRQRHTIHNMEIASDKHHLFPPVPGEDPQPTLRITPDV